MRKLNMAFVGDMGKAGAASALAYAYEDVAIEALMQKMLASPELPLPVKFVASFLAGWAPVAVATAYGGPFWAAFGGAIASNRFDNLMVAFGQPALTAVGSVQRGETLAHAQMRQLGGNVAAR